MYAWPLRCVSYVIRQSTGETPVLRANLRVTTTSDDGTIMGLIHADLPIEGVQFHPESIASEHGHDMIRNFLTRCRTKAAA